MAHAPGSSVYIDMGALLGERWGSRIRPDLLKRPNFEVDNLVWYGTVGAETYAPQVAGALSPEFIATNFEAVLSRMDLLITSLRETASALEIVQQRLDEVEERLAGQPVVCQVTIHDLNSDSLILRQPICVNVEEYDDETIARFPEVEVYASADTESEAIVLLKQEIVGLYEDLLGHAGKTLGRDPTRWLKLLRTLIAQNEPSKPQV